MKHLKGIIDRVEGDRITIELDGEVKTYIDKSLEKIYNEGDVVKIINNEIILDINETIKRKEKIKKMMGEIWE